MCSRRAAPVALRLFGVRSTDFALFFLKSALPRRRPGLVLSSSLHSVLLQSTPSTDSMQQGSAALARAGEDILAARLDGESAASCSSVKKEKVLIQGEVKIVNSPVLDLELIEIIKIL